MTISQIPLRIAQISDLHFGGALSLSAETMADVAEDIRRLEPDAVVVAGDLTTTGYEWEYEEAAAWLAGIEFPQIVIPGNHDGRNVGRIHFRRHFGEPFSRFAPPASRSWRSTPRSRISTRVASARSATRGSASSSTSAATSRSSRFTTT